MKPALFAPASACELTVGRAGALLYIRSFNNVCDVVVVRVATDAAGAALSVGAGRREGYAFRGTNATARGVARGGFDVYSTGADAFLALRPIALLVKGH